MVKRLTSSAGLGYQSEHEFFVLDHVPNLAGHTRCPGCTGKTEFGASAEGGSGRASGFFSLLEIKPGKL